MKSAKDETTQRTLLLLKLDAQNLMDRIRDRRQEFVQVFALRRTRDHFAKIFHSLYDQVTLRDLAHCSSETIVALDQFHKLVGELSWYLYQTEDMPATVEDHVLRTSKRLEKLHATLNLYLNAELSLDEAPAYADEVSSVEPVVIPEDLFSEEPNE